MRKVFAVLITLLTIPLLCFAGKGKLLVIPTENSIVLRWTPVRGISPSCLRTEVLRKERGKSWKKIATISPDVNLLKSKYSFLFEYFGSQEGSGKGLLDLVIISKLVSDPSLAKAMGTFYEDTDVSPEKEYLYKLIVYAKGKAVREYVSPSWTGIKNFKPYPPIEFSLTQEGNRIKVEWKPSERYVIYHIYRDGRCLNPEGILVLENNLKEDKMFFSDDGPFTEETEHSYQISGITLSGKRILSEEKRIVFKDLVPPSPPSEIKTKKVEEGKVVLFWQPVKEKDLDHYVVWRSTNLRNGYKKVGQTREITFTDKVSSGVYYYRVSGVDKSGNISPMFQALMVLVPDQTPPSPVKNLKAEAGPGLVKLSWKAPPEKDLYGYKVYRRVGEGEKFVLITPEAIKSTFFEDELDKRLDFPYIYYQVRALDRANNYSEPVLVKVKLPDVTPPATPLVYDHSFNEEGLLTVKLKYDTGDVRSLEILCGDEVLKTLKADGREEISLKLNLSGEKVLQFVAVDAAGNKSKPFNLRVFFPPEKKKNEIVLKKKKDHCELLYDLSYDNFFYIFDEMGRKISPAYYGNGSLSFRCSSTWRIKVFNREGEVVKELGLN